MTEHSNPPGLNLPGIALVGHRDDRRTLEGLRLLASVLGCPQLRVQAHGDPVPEETVAVIQVGMPLQAGSHRTITLSQGAALTDGAVLREPGGKRIRLPEAVRYDIVFNGFDAGDVEAKRIRACFFLISNGLIKAERHDRLDNLAHWSVLAAVALCATPRTRKAWDGVLRKLGPSLEMEEPITDEVLDRLVASSIEKHTRKAEGLSLAAFLDDPTHDPPKPVQRAFAKAPHLLALFAYRWRHRPEWTQQIVESITASWKPTSARLASIGCAYAIVGNDAKARATAAVLLSAAWRVTGQSHVRRSSDKDSPEKSPALLALLLYELFCVDPAACLEEAIDLGPLTWEAVQPLTADGTLTVAQFFDATQGVISRSLFDNWLKLQQLPDIHEGHLFLADRHYEAPCQAIERLWREIVFTILSSAGVPLVQLLPWPHGRPFAIALRYDVDRRTSPEQVSAILDIQDKHFGAEFSSWYFFAEAAHNASTRAELAGHEFEDARHTCRADDVPAGVGATAHSGPMSEYWTGLGYIHRAERQGAAYAESMITRYRLPRPGWTGDAMTRLWLTPLHFPLEGSTKDTTRAYFDKLLLPFRDQLDDSNDFGGLAIIGSHPDCNQTMLDDIISREGLAKGWPTTVAAAVARIKSIFEYGAVRLFWNPGDPESVHVSPVESIADLSVRVRFPAGNPTSAGLSDAVTLSRTSGREMMLVSEKEIRENNH